MPFLVKLASARAYARTIVYFTVEHLMFDFNPCARRTYARGRVLNANSTQPIYCWGRRRRLGRRLSLFRLPLPRRLCRLLCGSLLCHRHGRRTPQQGLLLRIHGHFDHLGTPSCLAMCGGQSNESGLLVLLLALVVLLLLAWSRRGLSRGLRLCRCLVLLLTPLLLLSLLLLMCPSSRCGGRRRLRLRLRRRRRCCLGCRPLRLPLPRRLRRLRGGAL